MIMSEAKPLTQEQVWGVPESDIPVADQLPKDWCPLRKRLCGYWDNECRADECVDI